MATAQLSPIKVTLSKGGTKEREVEVNDVEIPDMWHVAMRAMDNPSMAECDKELILQTWHTCHSLKEKLIELSQQLEPVG